MSDRLTRTIDVSRCALMLFLVLLIAPQAALAQTIHVLNSLAKPLPQKPSSAMLAHFETAPSLRAARGEAEALQLLVCADDKPIHGLRAFAGEFVHESGDSWTGPELKLSHVGLVETKEPYYGTLHVGLWPDPLLEDATVDVPVGECRAIWFEVTVPIAATAGLYSGEIRLEAQGWSDAVTVDVEVWDFVLPQNPSLATSFLLYPRYVYEFHQVKKGSAAADKMLAAYHGAMLNHRISPTHVLTDSPSTRPKLRISDDGVYKGGDFSDFDNQLAWARERGQRCFGIEGPRKVNEYSRSWYRAVGDHLADSPLLFYTYLFDETYEGVAEVTDMVKAAAPRLQNLITRLPASGFAGVDLWCPRLGDAHLHSARIAEAGLENGDMWVYTAGNAGSDVPALHLDLDGIEARATPLAVWRGGYAGLLFWCVNYWTRDPWLDPMVYPRQNGNGSLFYPGERGPLPSVRLKMLRDGMDDVDYAQLLADEDDPLADRILAALPVRSCVDWDRDPLSILSWRNAAGFWLSGDSKLAASWVQKAELQRYSRKDGGLSLWNVAAPARGWMGGRDTGAVARGGHRPAFRFTLDEEKWKVWRLPGERDWRAYGVLELRLAHVEGPPTRLQVKLGSGLIRRRTWNWEVHLAPGEVRTVSIPLPHERVNTASLTELTLFVWEPKSAFTFELLDLRLR